MSIITIKGGFDRDRISPITTSLFHDGEDSLFYNVLRFNENYNQLKAGSVIYLHDNREHPFLNSEDDLIYDLIPTNGETEYIIGYNGHYNASFEDGRLCMAKRFPAVFFWNHFPEYPGMFFMSSDGARRIGVQEKPDLIIDKKEHGMEYGYRTVPNIIRIHLSYKQYEDLLDKCFPDETPVYRYDITCRSADDSKSVKYKFRTTIPERVLQPFVKLKHLEAVRLAKNFKKAYIPWSLREMLGKNKLTPSILWHWVKQDSIKECMDHIDEINQMEARRIDAINTLYIEEAV
jgi:hypothetical protein